MPKIPTNALGEMRGNSRRENSVTNVRAYAVGLVSERIAKHALTITMNSIHAPFMGILAAAKGRFFVLSAWIWS